MKYDVISVGSASIDVFIGSKSKDIEMQKIHAHEDVCMPIGAKILLGKLYADVGGAGVNSSISFSRLGFKTGLLSKLGKDMHAEIILHRLKKEKVDFLGKIEKGQTGHSVILTGLKGNRTILTFKGANDNLTKKAFSWKKLKTKWFYFGTLLNKSWKTQCELAKYAKKNKIKILYNPSLYIAEKGKKFLKPVLDACSILILNKEEAQALTRKKAGIPTLLKELQKIIPIAVITDGAKGAYAYNGIQTCSITPKQVKVVEPTGAGDAFASGFLAAIMLNKDIQTALQWGAAQANSVIQHYGATNKLLTRKEIMKSKGGTIKCS